MKVKAARFQMSLGMETKQTKSSRVVILSPNGCSRIPELPEPVDSQTKSGGCFKRTRHFPSDSAAVHAIR